MKDDFVYSMLFCFEFYLYILVKHLMKNTVWDILDECHLSVISLKRVLKNGFYAKHHLEHTLLFHFFLILSDETTIKKTLPRTFLDAHHYQC
jgi:hypothetical protein